MVQPIVKETGTGRPFLQSLSSLLPDLKAHLIFWPLAVGGLLLDLWSKSAIFNWLEQNESYIVIENFMNIIRAQNPGAAWSIFSGKSIFLMAISTIAFVAIILIFLFSGRQPRIINAAMGLFAAGVSGNLHDRVFNDGHVRDFIDVYYRDFHWPTFNVADSLLVIGVGLLIISSFFIEKPHQKHDQPQK